jgi:FKBP-type peptidyl-prolyl cis-trans isomerase FklB
MTMKIGNTKSFRTIGVAGASLAAVLGCSLATAGNESPAAISLEDQSYSLGHLIGGQSISELSDIDRDAFLDGIADAVNGKDPALTTQAMHQALSDFEAGRNAAAQAAAEALAATNASEGEAFREQFAQQKGVTTLDNGLLYEVIEAGVGDPPEAGTSVTLHYKGSFVNGTEFDDSYGRDEPITVELDRVLPGWSAALERMPVGARWKVVIPPSLAYGETGAGGFIEPNQTLVFELERLANG